MFGVNNFSREGQGEINHVVVAEEKLTPLAKKKVVTSDKATTSENIDKGTENFDDMK